MGRSRLGALDRGLAVLETLVAAAPQVGLAEVALRVGLPKPTVHRILQVFISRGYAIQIAEGVYAPGLRILSLAGVVWGDLDYAFLARPAMLTLQDAFPETVHFAVLDGHQAVYAEKVEGRHTYRMASVVGMPLALHSTAIGKAILANLDPADFRAWASDGALAPRTSRTITSLAQLESELDLVRARGYAVDDEENEEEIRCVGAAVFDARGRVFGGVSTSAPAFLLRPEEIVRVGPHVLRAACRISLRAGLPPDKLPPPYAAIAVAANASQTVVAG